MRILCLQTYSNAKIDSFAMKQLIPAYVYWAMLIGLLSGIFACNSARESKDSSDALSTQKQTLAQPQAQPTYEEFQKMTPEERWHSLSPARRNYLRQNPNVYPYLKPYIDADPDLEPEPANPTPVQNQAPAFQGQSADFLNYSPDQWWGQLPPEWKQFIREHPELFPEYQHLVNKP